MTLMIRALLFLALVILDDIFHHENSTEEN